jgi:hypothetical protein
MKKALLASLTAFLLWGSSALAQAPPASSGMTPGGNIILAPGQAINPPDLRAPVSQMPGPGMPCSPELPCPVCFDGGPCCNLPSRFYFDAEYLLWWTKGQRLPPLVTVGSPDDQPPGALGQPETFVLIGDATVDDQIRSGGRFVTGLWLDNAATFGLEASGFLLEPRSSRLTAVSDGSTVLARPFFAVGTVLQEHGTTTDLTEERALLIALPGGSAGTAQVFTSNRFWGAEANGRVNVCCEACCRVDLLAGFRFLELKDRLNIVSASDTIPPSGSVTVTDDFVTRNRFYGGQLGAEAAFRHGRWFIDVRGKLALGALNRIVAIDGTTAFTTAERTTVVPGGLFAQPTNIGRHSDTEFGVVPEVGFRAGCQITGYLRVYVGYSLIYLARDVVQPGDQIDRAVNVNQIPALGVAPLVGDQRPAFASKNTDWWAQGLHFGLELDF